MTYNFPPASPNNAPPKITLRQLIWTRTKPARERFANLVAPELKERRNLLERENNTDALTGLANRRAFDLACPSAEDDSALAFIIFDANNFGQSNKIKGHAFGDELLQKIAVALTDAARQFGFEERVFRYAGDEFVIICPARVAALVRNDAERFFGAHEIAPNVFVSISGEIGSVVSAADARLQHRKAERKAQQAKGAINHV